MDGIFGGGGSTSKTKADANLPEELKPLAKSSAAEIMRTQDALPLSQFTGSQPQQVAGLSPFTVEGMKLIPGMTQPSPAEQSLFGQQQMWQNLIGKASNFQPSPVADVSSNFLLSRIGQSQATPMSSPLMPMGQPSNGGGGGSSFPMGAAAQLPLNVFGGVPSQIPAINEAGPSIPISPLMPTTSPVPPPQVAQGGGAMNGANIAAALEAYNNELVPAPFDPRMMIPRRNAEAFLAQEQASMQRPQGEG